MLPNGVTPMRRRTRTTHPACRSLLQKAVRRGDASIASTVLNHLAIAGDGVWLKSRASVIVAEECWPLAVCLDPTIGLPHIDELLRRVSRATKMKDAAGLGSLAYALSQGDGTVLRGGPSDREIRVIMTATQRPNDFWAWAERQATQDQQSALVAATKRAFRRGGWPWDRAFMLSAAFLAVTSGIPTVEHASHTSEPFPWWIALDKHTPEGKNAISAAAREAKVPVRNALWLSFYFESSLCNSLGDSPWWQRELTWRLSKLGLELDHAHEIWMNLRPRVMDRLNHLAQDLQKHLHQSEEQPYSQTYLL